MKIYRIAKSQEYMIENGLLYNENGDEVFSVKELINYNVPVFKAPKQANEFLDSLEQEISKKLGRVPDINYLKKLRYKDTANERADETLKYLEDRSKQLQRGEW